MKRRGLLILLCLLPALVDAERGRGARPETAAAATPTDAWPGWRGLGAEGRVAGPLPTRWSAEAGVRWKAHIPGRGHSSPIVFGDRVYVTTALGTTRGAFLEAALDLIVPGLVFAVAGLVLRHVTQRCRPDRSFTARDFAASTSMLVAAAGLVAIAGFGDAVFALGHSSIRAWMASAGFVAVCLALAGAGVGRGARVALALVAIAFAAGVLVAFPSRDLTFRGGLLSLRMQVALAAAAAPLLAGLALLVAASGRWRNIRGTPIVVVSIVLAAGAFALLRHLLLFRDVSFPETTYVPRLSLWLLPAAAAMAAVSWCVRQRQSPSFASNVTCVTSGAVLFVVAGAIGVESLLARSSYLSYQAGVSAPGAPAEEGAMWLAAMLIPIGAFIRRRAGRIAMSPAAVSAALAIGAVALGAAFFARTNLARVHTTVSRAIVSLDRGSGDVRWIARGLEGPESASDGRNSPATPTPVTDGRVTCAYFGSPGLMCVDAEGHSIWSRADIRYDNAYGVGFSPVMVDGTLVIAADGADGRAHIQALDVQTGAPLWSRAFATTPTLSGNSRTPIVRETDGEKALILWGMLYVKAIAVRSGETLWSHDITSGGDLVSSAVSDGERLYLSDATGTVALDYRGLAAGFGLLRWTSQARANCVSPVLSNGMLFTVTDAGVAAAIRADSGETLWRRRLPGHYFASLVASPSAVYFTNSDGLTTVIAAEPVFRQIAQNDLGEETMASPAAAGGELFVRTSGGLYAIHGH
jgi:outer membrane protein assembly factor BamB